MMNEKKIKEAIELLKREGYSVHRKKDDALLEKMEMSVLFGRFVLLPGLNCGKHDDELNEEFAIISNALNAYKSKEL